MKLWLSLLFPTLLVAACSDDAAPTLIIVEFRAEEGVRTEAARLEIEILGGLAGEVLESADRFSVEGSDLTWPVSTAPYRPKDGDVSRILEAEGELLDGDDNRIGLVRGQFSYARGKTRRVELLFEDSCASVSKGCNEGETCGGGKCQSPLADLATLPGRDGGSSGSGDGGSSGNGDGGSSGSGSGDDDVVRAIAEVGQPCAVEAALACDGTNAVRTLACEGGAWALREVCDSAARCDTELDRPTTGVCVSIHELCTDAAPGDLVCDGDARARCNADLIRIVDEPCPAPSTCNAEVPDDLCDDCAPDPCINATSCTDGAQTFTCNCTQGWEGDTCADDIDECALDSDTCDDLPDACVNTPGSFQCVCPAGFVGDGVGGEGCAPVLSGLEVAWGTLQPSFASGTQSYNLDIGLWADDVEFRASSTVVDATLTIDGQPASLDAWGMASVPTPGDHDVNLVLEAGGATTEYVVTVTRGVMEESYTKPEVVVDRLTFGRALALSADGSRLAIGATGWSASGLAGAVYVMRREGRFWVQEAELAADVPEGNDQFGEDVSLNADGTRLAVAAPNSSASGAFYVFDRTDETWGPPTTIPGGSNYERSVVLGSDGLLLVGGRYQTGGSQPGAVELYEWRPNGWAQIETFSMPNGQFGTALALDAQAQILAVSAPYRDVGSATSTGGVQVWRKNGGVWEADPWLVGSQSGRYDNFGQALDLSADGSLLLVLSVEGAYVFEEEGDQFVERALLPGSWSDVALAADGATLALGTGSPTQQVNVYRRRRHGTWTLETTVAPMVVDAGDGAGETVVLSSDGEVLVTSAPWEESLDPYDPTNNDAAGAGAVYTFDRAP